MKGETNMDDTTTDLAEVKRGSQIEPSMTRREVVTTGGRLLALAALLAGLPLDSLEAASRRRDAHPAVRLVPGFEALRVEIDGRALRAERDFRITGDGEFRLLEGARARPGQRLCLRYRDRMGSLRLSRYLLG